MPKTDIDVNETITLSPTSGGTWTSSDNAIATVTDSGVVKGVAAGVVQFTYTDSKGCSATTSSLAVHALPINLEVCENENVTFNATINNGGTTPLYQWQKNSVDINGATNSSYTYKPQNSDVISCLLTSNEHCVNPTTVVSNIIKIKVNKTPTVSNIIAPEMHCSGTALTIPTISVNGNGNPITNQGWQIEGAVNANTFVPLTLPYVTNRKDNNKKIRYFSTNACGTTYSNEVVLDIHTKPAIQTSASAPAATCEGKTVTLPPVTISGEGEAFTQVWQMETAVGSGVFVDFAVPYVASYNDNNKKIRTVATNTCGTSYSNEVALTINKALTPTFDFGETLEYC
jgi:hypothetical protein